MLWLIVLLYGLSVFVVSGWIFVWLMHVFAILNAKLNLHQKLPAVTASHCPSPPQLSPAAAHSPASTVIAVDEEQEEQNKQKLPGVSVIKPLVGVDPYLASNLDSFFCMRYPIFELLFCVNDDQDSSLEVVRRLMAKYPAVDAKVFVGGCKVGTNPKINNMQPGYAAAAYDIILISDSGIKSELSLSHVMVMILTVLWLLRSLFCIIHSHVPALRFLPHVSLSFMS
jgi:ceramide glucosyltransferase